MGNTSGYDALATPECGHTTARCGLSPRWTWTLDIPIKSHQLIITPIIVTIFSSMRCYGASRDPILEELLHYLCFVYIYFFKFQARLLQVCWKFDKHRFFTVDLLWWKSGQDPDVLQKPSWKIFNIQACLCVTVWQMRNFCGDSRSDISWGNIFLLLLLNLKL